MKKGKLDSLEERLDEARQEFDRDYNSKSSTEEQSMNVGARAGVELVGAVLGGALIGWLLDRFFNTSPALFLVFIILGIITGFYNVYRITNNLGTAVGSRSLRGETKNAKNPPSDDSQR